MEPFYRVSHTQVMASEGVGFGRAKLELAFEYRKPYDWASFLAFIRPRAIPGLEIVGEDSYQRLGITIVQHSEEDRLLALNAAPAIEQQARFFLDTSADPSEISQCLSKSPLLNSIVQRFPGLRIPRCWDPFELAVRAILGQQVTVKGASTLAGRLVERFGAPNARILLEADLETIGLPKARAETIRDFARAVCDGRIDFSGTASNQEMIGRMCKLPGIGPWTANYIAMRALGDSDAFPASDLGLLRAAGVSSARQLETMSEEWRPFRSYAAMYLWQSLRDPA